MKSRIVLQKGRVNNEVGISCVFSNREVGVTSVQVDRLGASQNDRVTLFTESNECVEEHLSCGNVNWRDHAKSSSGGVDKY